MSRAERDDGGRFANGNTGGPGRPRKRVEQEYMRTLSEACSLDDWAEIVEKMVTDAKAGDARAREVLLRYLVGTPEKNAPPLRLLMIPD